jgi:hypothetical protein
MACKSSFEGGVMPHSMDRIAAISDLIRVLCKGSGEPPEVGSAPELALAALERRGSK